MNGILLMTLLRCQPPNRMYFIDSTYTNPLASMLVRSCSSSISYRAATWSTIYTQSPAEESSLRKGRIYLSSRISNDWEFEIDGTQFVDAMSHSIKSPYSIAHHDVGNDLLGNPFSMGVELVARESDGLDISLDEFRL